MSLAHLFLEILAGLLRLCGFGLSRVLRSLARQIAFKLLNKFGFDSLSDRHALLECSLFLFRLEFLRSSGRLRRFVIKVFVIKFGQ